MPSAVKLYFSWTWGDSDRRTRRWELDTSVVPRRNGFFARVGDPRASRSSFAAHFTVPAVVYRVVTVFILLVPSRLYTYTYVYVYACTVCNFSRLIKNHLPIFCQKSRVEKVTCPDT